MPELKWTDVSFALIFTGAAILAAGCLILFLLDKRDDHPLRPYTLQILGLTLLLPVILVLGSVKTLNSEAVSALMGAMVAFIFGNVQQQPNESRDKKQNSNPGEKKGNKGQDAKYDDSNAAKGGNDSTETEYQ